MFPTCSAFTQHFQNLPNIFIIYPSFPEFTQHLQNLPNIFRIYPTPSEFTQHFQNLPNTFRICPTPSEFTHHLHNLPTTFRIHPPSSEKIGFEAAGPFCTFLDLFRDPKKRRFLPKCIFGKIDKLNDHLHKLN